MGPGAGAEIKLINIFCSQFGGCYDEDKFISTSSSIVLLFQNSLKCQYMAVAGAGTGAEMMVKVGAGVENKYFGSATLVLSVPNLLPAVVLIFPSDLVDSPEG